jgi:exodeoxyribonuclease VIII
MMKDVMLDLETYGVSPGCVVRSIGAVAFDPVTGSVGGEHFYHNITLRSCIEVGLKVEEQTLVWWDEQEEVAKKMLMIDQRKLIDVAEGFNMWWEAQEAERVWANGAAFDPVVWEFAVKACGKKVPWRYNKVMDTRTVSTLHWMLKPDTTITVEDTGRYTPHYAVDDCRYQVNKLMLEFDSLKGGPDGNLRT